MIIRSLVLENFGSVVSFKTLLDPRLCVLDTRYVSDIHQALELVMCSKSAEEMGERYIKVNTKISAEVLLGEKLCSVKFFSSRNEPQKLTLSVIDSSGYDVTEDYLRRVKHHTEQDISENFDGSRNDYGTRLCVYRNLQEQKLGKGCCLSSDTLMRTKIFRALLLRYIKDFEPEPISNFKNYMVLLGKEGKFRIVHPEFSQPLTLSEAEEKLFRFICFLSVAQFWEDVEKIRDIHHEKKPITVRNFLEFLDESTDVQNLILRTLRFNRQVIILTHSLPKDLRKKLSLQNV